jgi:hypothetical protein
LPRSEYSEILNQSKSKPIIIIIGINWEDRILIYYIESVLLKYLEHVVVQNNPQWTLFTSTILYLTARGPNLWPLLMYLRILSEREVGCQTCTVPA